MRAEFRPERTDFRPERTDSRPERADSRPEMANFKPEKANFRPERVDFWPERAWGDEQTEERMNECPPVFYRTLSPLGPLPKKRKIMNFC